MPISPSETHHGERCSNLHSSLRDHPARMVVLLALRYEGSEHRESRDLSLDLTSLTATLSRIVLLSPLDSALTSKRAPKSFTCNTYEKHTGGEGVPLPIPAFPPAEAPVVQPPSLSLCYIPRLREVTP